MQENNNSESICDAVVGAHDSNSPVLIQAGNSKSFYGNDCEGEKLDVRQHIGIIDYEPSELYITARCGTPLQEIESVLKEQNHRLTDEVNELKAKLKDCQ